MESTAPNSGAPTGILARHQAELNAGRWFIQRCTACQRSIYFPRELCPHCGSLQLQWQTPSGLGTVYATTTVRRKPADGGDINVSLIDLDEGVRMMSRVDNGAPADVHIGQRVRARVVDADGKGLVLFDAIEDVEDAEDAEDAKGTKRLEGGAP